MKPIYLILIAVIILLGGGIAWFFMYPSSITFTDLSTGLFGGSPATSTDSNVSASREAPAGQKEYQNQKYKFSLFYPESLSVKEINEGGGAMTITFENTKTLEGFQIFIVPFAGEQITDDRFKKDIPSGVRENIQNIQIDGAVGASFFSKDLALGETAEVWFINGGYLYEVNTFKKLAPWLSQILSTWKFLE